MQANSGVTVTVGDLSETLKADLEHFEERLADLKENLGRLDARLGLQYAKEKPWTKEESEWIYRARVAKSKIQRDIDVILIDIRKTRGKIKSQARQDHLREMVASHNAKVEKLKAALRRNDLRQKILVEELRELVGEAAFRQACLLADSKYEEMGL